MCAAVEDRFTTELIIFAKIDWPVQWTYSHSQCQAFFLETVYSFVWPVFGPVQFG